MIKLKPLFDRLIIETLESDQITASGIIIPETASKEKPMQGIVVAVGDGRIADDGTIIPMKVKVGDSVVFSKYVPEEIETDGKKYLIIREDSVLAIINK